MELRHCGFALIDFRISVKLILKTAKDEAKKNAS